MSRLDSREIHTTTFQGTISRRRLLEIIERELASLCAVQRYEGSVQFHVDGLELPKSEEIRFTLVHDHLWFRRDQDAAEVVANDAALA